MRKKESVTLEQEYPYFLLLLSAISTANVSSKDLIKFASTTEEYPLSAKIFRKLDLMVNKWDFNQVRALKLLAHRIIHEGYRKLLLKLAQIISVGTSIKEFLRLEFSRLMMSFENEFETMCCGGNRFCFVVWWTFIFFFFFKQKTAYEMLM